MCFSHALLQIAPMDCGGKQITQVIGVTSPESFRAAVLRAVELLRAGQLVALPTETVYGLAANAFDATAVGRIFEVKGRPAHNPIIVHVAGHELARACVSSWPPIASRLADAFWPGPLTLVLPRSRRIPEIVTAGGSTVGVRWPSHPIIQAVINECAFPLAAPSANSSNRLSPTNAQHVLNDLGGKIPLIVDGGQSQVGIESTVLDLSTSPPRLLRPGMIHRQALLAVTGELVIAHDSGDEVLKSPGLLRKHYAPKAKLALATWSTDAELWKWIQSSGTQRASVHVIAYAHIPSDRGLGRVAVLPHDPEAFGRALYGELHRCDQLGARLILVESPPDAPEWAAIADRLRRASA